MSRLAGAGSYDDPAALENDYERPGEEDGTVDAIIDESTERLQATPGALGAVSFLYQTGQNFEGNEEEVRETVMEDDDAPWVVKATTASSTLVSDPSGDAASDTVEVLTTHAAGDASDRVTDAASDAVDEATDFVPDWLSWAAAAAAVATVLALLSYAFGQLVTLEV